MNEFKDMLQYYRKANGMTQKDLAKVLHLSTSTIGMYESGKRYPERDIEEAIADYFNVNLSTLRGKQEPTSEIMEMLADVIIDKNMMSAIEKMKNLSEENKNALYQYIDFLCSK